MAGLASRPLYRGKRSIASTGNLKSPALPVGINMPSTLLPEPPRPRLHRGRVRHPARVRLALILLRLTIVLILGGLVAGGWYLAKKGFSRNWRNKVVEELHKRGRRGLSPPAHARSFPRLDRA